MAELAMGIAGGGTGARIAADARANLGIEKASAASTLGGIAGFAGFSRAYRIPLLSGSGGSDGYQLRLLIGESSGSPSVDLHVNGKSQDFPSAENTGGDFKVVKADGSNVSFFVERVTGTTPNRVAAIWIACPNGTAADVFFLLTGNATSIANQSDSTVFPDFYDSFAGSALNIDRWTAMNSTGLTVGGGSMRHTNNSARVRSNATFSTGVILETVWNGAARNSNGHIVAGFGNAVTLAINAIGYLWHPNQDYIRSDSTWIAQTSTLAANTEILTRMTATGVGIFAFMNIRHENYQTGQQLFDATFSNAILNENIVIGHRFDGGNPGQAVDISWRWVRTRQQGTAPTLGTVREV